MTRPWYYTLSFKTAHIIGEQLSNGGNFFWTSPIWLRRIIYNYDTQWRSCASDQKTFLLGIKMIEMLKILFFCINDEIIQCVARGGGAVSGVRSEISIESQKWPSSKAHTIFFAKYALKRCKYNWIHISACLCVGGGGGSRS